MTRTRGNAAPGLLHRTLLSLPPETAHDAGISLLRVAQGTAIGRAVLARHAPSTDSRIEQELLDLPFSNPVGLAA